MGIHKLRKCEHKAVGINVEWATYECGYETMVSYGRSILVWLLNWCTKGTALHEHVVDIYKSVW